MFKAFSPNRGRFYFCLYLVAAGGDLWQAGGGDWLLRITGASQDVAISAAVLVAQLSGVLRVLPVLRRRLRAVLVYHSPHRWQYWSILGTSLIIFVTGFW